MSNPMCFFRREQDDFNVDPTIRDPPAIRHKGGPRTSRITAAREGVIRGGGGQRRPRQVDTGDQQSDENEEENDVSVLPPRKRARAYRCGICHEQGHNRQNCPAIANR